MRINLVEAVRAGLSELWAYRGRTILQTLGVALGSGSFIVSVALLLGSQAQSQEFMETTGGVRKLEVRQKTTGHMRLFARHAQNAGLTTEDLEAVREELQSLGAIVGGVQGVPGRAATDGKPERSNITGVTPEHLVLDKRSMLYGRYITEADVRTAAPVAVVGTTIANHLFGATDVVGLELEIVPPQNVVIRQDDQQQLATPTPTVETRVPNRYRIVGVMEEKVYKRDEDSGNWLEWMNRQVHIPITAAMYRELGSRNIATIEVLAPDMESVPKIKDGLHRALARHRRGDEDYTVFDRADRLKDWQDRRKGYMFAILGVGIISLLVGGIVIMNILLASFAQRVREVGLRKAMGARDTEIFAQFLVESVLVAGTGGAFGVVLGIAVSGTVSSMMEMKLLINVPVILTALIVAAGTGFIFGIYPGIRAALLDPVVALRYE